MGLADASRPDRVPLGLQTARGVDGQLAAEAGFAALERQVPLALLEEADFLALRDLQDGERVVQFSDIHVARRDACHLEGLGRGAAHRQQVGRFGALVDAVRIGGLPHTRQPDQRFLQLLRNLG